MSIYSPEHELLGDVAATVRFTHLAESDPPAIVLNTKSGMQPISFSGKLVSITGSIASVEFQDNPNVQGLQTNIQDGIATDAGSWSGTTDTSGSVGSLNFLVNLTDQTTGTVQVPVYAHASGRVRIIPERFLFRNRDPNAPEHASASVRIVGLSSPLLSDNVSLSPPCPHARIGVGPLNHGEQRLTLS